MNKYKQDLINLQHDFEKKKKEIEEKEKLYRLNILTSKDREIAEFLHDRFCKSNHTNECDYDPIIVKDIISLATDPV